MQWLTPPLHVDLRHAVFDAYQKLSPRPYSPQPVRIVDIDDESLTRVGQWPWPRDVLADLVDKLAEAGATAIIFDAVFAEPDRAAPRRYLEKWQGQREIAKLIYQLPDPDVAFAEALSRAPSVTGFSLNIGKDSERAPALKARAIVSGGDPAKFLPQFSKAVLTLAELESAAHGNGSVNFIPDGDGVIRRVPTVMMFGQEIYPSLAMEALRVGSGARNMLISIGDGTPEGEDSGLNSVRVGDHVIPTDRQGQIWLHYSDSVPERFIPAWQVLKGAMPDGEVKDSYVFIGPSAEGLKDLRFSPLGLIPGVEVHAQLVEQILEGSLLQRPFWTEGTEMALIFLMWLVVVPAAFRLSAAWGAAITILAAGAVVCVSWLAFAEGGLLISPVMPVFAAVGVFLGAAVPRFIDSERQRRWISNAFSSYISPNLVSHLIENPDSLALGGERRECSFVLTDLAGFTGLVERSDPARVSELLNAYLDGMVEIAFSHDGTLDRIVGDAVAVMFSAPVVQADHADRAVRCALEMHAFASRFSESRGQDGLPLGPTRIGVNTGMVTVGNFGGGTMFDYRALGDAINTASRLENANRHFGTQVCVSAATVERCSSFTGRPIGDLMLVGKTLPMRAFEPMSDVDLQTEHMQGYLQAFALLEKSDGAAEAAFAALLQRWPDDRLAQFHLDRLRSGENGPLVVLNQK